MHCQIQISTMNTDLSPVTHINSARRNRDASNQCLQIMCHLGLSLLSRSHTALLQLQKKMRKLSQQLFGRKSKVILHNYAFIKYGGSEMTSEPHQQQTQQGGRHLDLLLHLLKFHSDIYCCATVVTI